MSNFEIFKNHNLLDEITAGNLETVKNLITTAREYFPYNNILSYGYNGVIANLWATKTKRNIPHRVIHEQRGPIFSYSEYLTLKNPILTAVIQEQTEIAIYLLTLPEIKNTVHLNFNEVFFEAICKKNQAIIDILSKNDLVLSQTHRQNNRILEKLIYHSNFELFEGLASLPNVRHTLSNDDNFLLKKAAQSRDPRFAAFLLKDKNVKALSHRDQKSTVITVARTSGNLPIIALLRESTIIAEIDDKQKKYAAHATQIDTHGASIHASTSASAINLMNKYKIEDFENMYIWSFESFCSKSNNIAEIVKMTKINGEFIYNDKDSDEEEQKEVLDSIEKSIKLIMNSTFVDPKSEKCLPDLFKSILIAINKLDIELKINAQLKLAEHLYALYNEGGFNIHSCEPGYFNSIIQSMVSILDEVSIKIQTKSDVTIRIQTRLNDFARSIFSRYGNLDLGEYIRLANEIFETEKVGYRICRDLLTDSYLTFGFQSYDEANDCDDSVLSICTQANYGYTCEQLLESISLEEIYKKHMLELLGHDSHKIRHSRWCC